MGKKSNLKPPKKPTAESLQAQSIANYTVKRTILDNQNARLLLKRIYEQKNDLSATISQLSHFDISDIFRHELSLQSDDTSNLSEEQVKKNISSRLFELDKFFIEYTSKHAKVESLQQDNQSQNALTPSSSRPMSKKLVKKLEAKKVSAIPTVSDDATSLNEFIAQREVAGKLLINSIYYLINTPEKIALLNHLICDDYPERMYFLMRKFGQYFLCVQNGAGFQADKLLKILNILLNFFADDKYYAYFNEGKELHENKEKRGRREKLLHFIMEHGHITEKNMTARELDVYFSVDSRDQQQTDIIHLCMTRTEKSINNTGLYGICAQFGIKIRPYLLLGIISIDTVRNISQSLLAIIEKLFNITMAPDIAMTLFELLIFSENLEMDCVLHENKLLPNDPIVTLTKSNLYGRFLELEENFFQIERVDFAAQMNRQKGEMESANIFIKIMLGKDFSQKDFAAYLTGLSFTSIARLDTHIQLCDQSVEHFANTQIVIPTMPLSDKYTLMQNLGALQQEAEKFSIKEGDFRQSLQNLYAFLQNINTTFSSLIDKSSASEPKLCVGGIVYLRLLELIYMCEMLSCYAARRLAENVDAIIKRIIGNKGLNILELKRTIGFFFEKILPELEQMFNTVTLSLPEPINVDEFRCFVFTVNNLFSLPTEPGKERKEVFSHEQVLFYRKIFSCRKGVAESKDKIKIEENDPQFIAAEYLLALQPISHLVALCNQLEMFYSYHQQQAAIDRAKSSNSSLSSEILSDEFEEVDSDNEQRIPYFDKTDLPSANIDTTAKLKTQSKPITPLISELSADVPKFEPIIEKKVHQPQANKQNPPSLKVDSTLSSSSSIASPDTNLSADNSVPFQTAKKRRNARRRLAKEKAQKPQSAIRRKIPLQLLDDAFLKQFTRDDTVAAPSIATASSSSSSMASTNTGPSLKPKQRKHFTRKQFLGESIPIEGFKLDARLARFHQKLHAILNEFYPGSELIIFGSGAFELVRAFQAGSNKPPELCDLDFGLAIQEKQAPSKPGLTLRSVAAIHIIQFEYMTYKKLLSDLQLNFSVIILPKPRTSCLISGLNNDYAHCGIYIQNGSAFALDPLSLITLRTKELVPMDAPETFVTQRPISLLRAGHFLEKPHDFHWPTGYEGVIKITIGQYLSIDDWEKHCDCLHVFKKLHAEVTRMGAPFCQFLLSYGLWGILCGNDSSLGIELILTPEDLADISLLKTYMGDSAGIFAFFILHSWHQFKTIYHHQLLSHDAPLFLEKALETATQEKDKKNIQDITYLVNAAYRFWLFPKNNIPLSESAQKEILNDHFMTTPTKSRA